MSKMTGMSELSTLLNSRRRAILIQTYEESRFEEEIVSLVQARQQNIFSWTLTSGLYDVNLKKEIEKIYDPIKIMNYIDEHKESSVFILKDFHDIWSNAQAKRRLRDTLESQSDLYKPLLFVTPHIDIPMELEKLITVVSFDLPTREEVEEQLVGMEILLENNDLEKPQGRERVAIINALVGMTQSEVINVLKKSVAKHKKVSLDEIVAEKEQVIKKTGLLEYVTKLGDMDEVGGLDVLKDWFENVKYAFEQEARDYDIDPARGVIVTGFPGVGKSLTAKSVAHSWNLPLLKMNMSDIMDSKVGQSEKNMTRALKLAEAVSPCVLWIDEIEKALAGMDSSNRSDGGTTSRVLTDLLTWLSDKDAPVFVIATANDITILKPELTRAGRFDDIFFVSLPSQSEREEIYTIHFRKRNYNTGNVSTSTNDNYFSDEDIQIFAKLSEGFTGAEIEQVVSEAGRQAYADFRRGKRPNHYMCNEDVLEKIQKIVPLSKRNPQLLTDLRDWAKQSAKCASSEEHKLIHGSSDQKAKLMEIDFPDIQFD